MATLDPFRCNDPRMKRIDIHHTTRYGFAAPVQLGQHRLLVRPREGHDLHIASSTLNIVPEPVLTWRRDFYDNVQCIASFSGPPVTELVIDSELQVELYEIMPLDFVVEDHAVLFPFTYQPDELTALRPYLTPLYQDHPALTAWLEPYQQLPEGTETFAVLDRLNHQINTEIGYEVRDEVGVLSPADSLERRRGSCRDMAALLLESCRRLGIASRFVSGYVHGPATEVGGAASHAWAEVYLPGAGWKGFDPTNASVVGPDHIRVAVHHHPEAVSPVSGSFTGPKGLQPTLEVDVQIHQVAED